MRLGKSPRLATVLPVAGLAAIGAALAAATGKVGWVISSLPLTPTPNGFTLLCVAVLVAGCWWRLRSIDTPPHPQLELVEREKWPAGAEPLADATWPEGLDPERAPWRPHLPPVEPWFGPRPIVLDPDEGRPTLLPATVQPVDDRQVTS